jgi:hypothetical protein
VCFRPDEGQEPSDVLNDIGNMLANLTDELDAMLEEEKRQGLGGQWAPSLPSQPTTFYLIALFKYTRFAARKKTTYISKATRFFRVFFLLIGLRGCHCDENIPRTLVDDVKSRPVWLISKSRKRWRIYNCCLGLFSAHFLHAPVFFTFLARTLFLLTLSVQQFRHIAHCAEFLGDKWIALRSAL